MRKRKGCANEKVRGRKMNDDIFKGRVLHGTLATRICPRRHSSKEINMESERKGLISISKDLRYPDETRKKLLAAKSSEEMSRIMSSARRSTSK